MQINIYTDGACRGNPGPGGWGCVMVTDNDKQIAKLSDGEQDTTNNRMELTGFLNALKWFVTQSEYNILCVYVDSAYIYNCFNDMWYIRWLKNDWKNANKKPVANKDLWEEILNIYLNSKEQISVIKVNGHSGNKWNEYVDNLAVRASLGENK